jgi:hypothetical protein
MTIGANLNGGSLTLGSANVSVNIPSGTINAKYFTLRQTTYGNATNTVLIDTTKKTTFTTQIGIADTNAEEVYIGNGAQLKKLILANVATTVASEITIGNSNSITNLIGNTLIGTVGGSNSITINKPLTVGYTPPTDSLASLAFIGGTYKATSAFVYTISTTNRAFAPLNGLPIGRYLFKVYVFLGGNTPTEVIAILCNSSSAITNSQSTGLTLIYDGNEAYCVTSLTGRVSLNPVFLYDVASPNNNIAIAVQSGINLSSANVFTINAIRIG